MADSNFTRADQVDVTIPDEPNLPQGWEQTHREHKRPVSEVGGYYIHTYESEHFLISHDTEQRINGERVHHVALLKVKRNEDGERLTAIGAGVYQNIAIPEDAPSFVDDREGHLEAHEEAEKAALQVAVNMMHEVNDGKYDHLRYSESERHN